MHRVHVGCDNLQTQASYKSYKGSDVMFSWQMVSLVKILDHELTFAVGSLVRVSLELFTYFKWIQCCSVS